MLLFGADPAFTVPGSVRDCAQVDWSSLLLVPGDGSVTVVSEALSCMTVLVGEG